MVRLQGCMSHIQNVWGQALAAPGPLASLTASLCGTMRRRCGVREVPESGRSVEELDGAEEDHGGQMQGRGLRQAESHGTGGDGGTVMHGAASLTLEAAEGQYKQDDVGQYEHDDQYAFPCSAAVSLLHRLARLRLASMQAEVDRLSAGGLQHEEL